MEQNIYHSVVLKERRCIGCTSCLKACPTEAIRIYHGKAAIIPERCIDCGLCIAICPNHAKTAVTDHLSQIQQFKYNIAVPSMTIFGQFMGKHAPEEILHAIKSLGFDEVWETSYGGRVICTILNKKAREAERHEPNAPRTPMINSSCPAIIRLIQTRYPSLIPNIVNLETSLEITALLARKEAVKKTGLKQEEIGVTYISPCTARATSAKKPLGIDKSCIDIVVSMKDVFGDILRNLMAKEHNRYPSITTQSDIHRYCVGGQGICLGADNYISVDGIHDVMCVLEEIEMGKLENILFLEAAACRGGCFGGPLTVENSFVARAKIQELAADMQEREATYAELKEHLRLYETGEICLNKPIEESHVMRLDEDFEKSMVLLMKAKDIAERLPGIDCGVCGSPTCMAFAEDIVKGFNKGRKCYVSGMKEDEK